MVKVSLRPQVGECRRSIRESQGRKWRPVPQHRSKLVAGLSSGSLCAPSHDLDPGSVRGHMRGWLSTGVKICMKKM